MKLEDWLDDLCVRFIINLPKSELESVERICFQVEEAQWFYEDFIRPLDPSLPSLNLRAFSLKIFQHCSLFSQWSPEHHMSAFAEFLAYKQRVPVRGAIMLNQDMDQVVLVKGWKKGANWSFPRGKINKDENDLDCAVREVYEETGFDIKEAGLVKEEKEMKHIEVTMREQHMRLYVFRGVPMTTHFEPRTRKEISKIEWYRLTELPTLKKHKHQDSNGQPQVINANKFYMVAPFLNPLKKWISQQRKNDSRQCLPHLAPLNFLEEISQDEDETLRPHLHQVPSHGPSNLPEVAYTQSEAQDPSADLKRLLNININGPQQMATPHPIKAPPPNNLAKSSALLALLRSGSTAEMRDGPLTPRDQISFAPGAPRSPHRPQAYEPPFPSMSSAPQFQISPAPAHGGASQSRMQPVEIIQRQDLSPTSRWQAKLPSHSTSTEQPSQLSPMVSLQRFAPYQNTGDPQFSRPKADSSRMSGVPPASALPKLTNHTKSLLDAFKLAPSVPGSAPNSAPSARGLLGATPQISSLPSTHSQSLLDIFKTTPSPVMGSTQVETTDRLSGRDRRQNLMDLFQHPSTNLAAQMQPGETIKIASQPAELAANVVNMATPKLNTDQGQSKTKKQNKHAAPREGETTATVSGPLNQPQFEGIIRSTRKATNGGRRSPVPANKTLYDHKNPTPVKILTRPEDSRGSPGRSPPRLSNARPSGSSPRRGVVSKEGKEPPKVFQPQILRRPQTPSSSALQARKESANEIAAPSSVSDQAEVPVFRKNPLQAESHRQALLSLFNNPLQIAQTSTAPQDPISAVSNVTTSQAGSPITDGQTQPISTRSRVGSLASIGGRPRIEKRQTAAGDKAFLLGYLGRIANQEGSQ